MCACACSGVVLCSRVRREAGSGLAWADVGKAHRAGHDVAQGGGDEVEGDELLHGHVGACSSAT